MKVLFQTTKILYNFYLDLINPTKILTKISGVKIIFVKNFLNQSSTINFRFKSLGVR